MVGSEAENYVSGGVSRLATRETRLIRKFSDKFVS
jgi:hypothetical protein